MEKVQAKYRYRYLSYFITRDLINAHRALEATVLRGEDDEGRGGVDGCRRPSTTDAQNWLMRQILVLK